VLDHGRWKMMGGLSVCLYKFFSWSVFSCIAFSGFTCVYVFTWVIPSMSVVRLYCHSLS
jgi:hypothetical protein